MSIKFEFINYNYVIQYRIIVFKLFFLIIISILQVIITA